MRWDADTYDRSFGYVSANGVSLVDVLDPQPGERILDLGCGTGGVTAEIAARGAAVTGLDSDAEMIAAARAGQPELEFHLADGHTFDARSGYDAVFSNAALHWMTDPDTVIGQVRQALRTGGRFVAEMGAGG